jgi:hypothetical protein
MRYTLILMKYINIKIIIKELLELLLIFVYKLIIVNIDILESWINSIISLPTFSKSKIFSNNTSNILIIFCISILLIYFIEGIKESNECNNNNKKYKDNCYNT